MRTIDALLSEVPVFAGLAPDRVALIAGCAVNGVFSDGEYLLREGDRADRFFVVRAGRVAIQTHAPQGGAVTIETLHEHDVVGWSWLVPPHRAQFDARALDTVHAIVFDGACLRGKCDADPSLGYELLQRFSALIVERLQATRLRLIDVYGDVTRA